MVIDVLMSFLWKFFEIVTITILISKLLDIGFTTIAPPILSTLILILTESYVTVCCTANDVFIYILNLGTMILITKLFFHKSIFDTFFLYGSAYCICVILQLIIMLFMGLTSSTLTDTSSKLIGNILTIFLAVLLCKFVPVHIFYKNMNQVHKYIKLLLCNCYLLIFFFVLYSKLYKELFFQSFTVVVIGCLLILYFNIHTLYYTHHIEQQRMELDSYKRYLPIVNELIDFVRVRQHGFDNRLLSLRALPMNYNSYEELAHAINKNVDITLQDYSATKLLKLNHKLVSGFLFNKYYESLKAGYTLDIKLLSYELPSHIPEYILIDIMGILLDNALEASPKESPVYFIVDSSKCNRIKICCKNEGPQMTPEFRRNMFKKGYTTKADEKKEHGLGLFTLKKYLKQYNGIILTLANEMINNRRYLVFEIEI